MQKESGNGTRNTRKKSDISKINTKEKEKEINTCGYRGACISHVISIFSEWGTGDAVIGIDLYSAAMFLVCMPADREDKRTIFFICAYAIFD